MNDEFKKEESMAGDHGKAKSARSSSNENRKWIGTKGPQQETSGQEWETQGAPDYKGICHVETYHLEKTEVLCRGNANFARNSWSSGKRSEKNPPKN